MGEAREIRIGEVSVPPGAAARHALEVAELADGSRAALPVLVVNGVEPGPRLYLGAAIHGDESLGVEVVGRVLARLDPRALRGGVIGVPVQNPLAFRVDHRIPVGLYLKSPLDQAPIDPWAAFPGSPEGNVTEQLAHTLFGLVRQCDHAVDIHTPTRGGRYVPITILPPPALGEAFARAETLAHAFGAGHVMRSDRGMYVRDGILAVEATRVGIPAFTFELGEGGRLEPELADLGVRCVLNALRHLGMVAGAVEPPAETVVLREFVGLRARRGGLLHTEARLGARVRRGDVLARIVDVWGDEVEVFRSPVDGIFVRATTLATVGSGERVATVGV